MNFFLGCFHGKFIWILHSMCPGGGLQSILDTMAVSTWWWVGVFPDSQLVPGCTNCIVLIFKCNAREQSSYLPLVYNGSNCYNVVFNTHFQFYPFFPPFY